MGPLLDQPRDGRPYLCRTIRKKRRPRKGVRKGRGLASAIRSITSTLEPTGLQQLLIHQQNFETEVRAALVTTNRERSETCAFFSSSLQASPTHSHALEASLRSTAPASSIGVEFYSRRSVFERIGRKRSLVQPAPHADLLSFDSAISLPVVQAAICEKLTILPSSSA